MEVDGICFDRIVLYMLVEIEGGEDRVGRMNGSAKKITLGAGQWCTNALLVDTNSTAGVGSRR